MSFTLIVVYTLISHILFKKYTHFTYNTNIHEAYNLFYFSTIRSRDGTSHNLID